MDDITRILSEMAQGDQLSAERLLPLMYDELRRLASQKLRHEAPGQTLQATALVHEVWLRLNCGENGKLWSSRAHFFGAAAEAMRRILVENARRKRGPKSGGGLHHVSLDAVSLVIENSGEADTDDLESLDVALTKLSAAAPRKAELVKLRYFAGLTIAQAAAVMGISIATAERDWEYARVWLYCELSGNKSPPGNS